MPPKKAKGQKMDLNAFLNDEATGSWADEMDSFPTAPSGEPSQPGGLGGSHLRNNDFASRSGGFGDRGDYGDRAPRAEIPIPNAPPYCAFVGNLSFDYTEMDLEDFFAGLNTTSIRLVMGMDNKPKGFGYVEFDSVDNLKAALAMSGRDVGGRTVRISVAEPPKGREGRADEDISWTRSGPLAPLPGRGGSSFGAGREGGGGFDRPREGGFGGGFGGAGGEIERDGERMGFGSKFVPSVDAPRRTGGFERAPMGTSSYDRAGVGAPSEDRGERAGFGSKFVAAPPMQERPPFGGDRRVSGGPGEGRSDEEKTWSRSGPLAPLPGRGGAFGAREGGGGFDRPRDGGFGDRISPAGTPESTAPRRRLELSAKSTSTETSPAASPASARPSPFGNARPIDNSEKQKEVEAKIAKSKAELATRTAPRSDAFARREPVVAREEPSKAPAETPVAVADVQEKVADLII